MIFHSGFTVFLISVDDQLHRFVKLLFHSHHKIEFRQIDYFASYLVLPFSVANFHASVGRQCIRSDDGISCIHLKPRPEMRQYPVSEISRLRRVP
jgi:hypothetical protein